MVDFQCKDSYNYQDLLRIMKLLRSPGGCPWDRKQTHASIRRNFLEETYEAVDAIDRDDKAGMCEELGDVLMQVIFHADLEEESGGFTMEDVVNGICRKLVYRHPHVFGEVHVNSSDEVLTNWEALKRREKGQATTADAIDAVARTLPALWRAEKMQAKAAKAGFDWASPKDALDKLSEETDELRQAMDASEDLDAPHGIREEIGDLLFAVTRIAQENGVDPDDALQRSCDKFARRYRCMEETLDRPMNELSTEEMLALWEAAKKSEKS